MRMLQISSRAQSKLTPGTYTLHAGKSTTKKVRPSVARVSGPETHVISSSSQDFAGARNLFPSERQEGLRTRAVGDDGVERAECRSSRHLSLRNIR